MDYSVHPRISVCMPVFNGSGYIAEAIQSVLAQTYTDFDLIVCDNRSTDDTEEIVLSFSDPRVTFVKNVENLGPVGNANRCLDLADGEYVCIFHHDDIMLPDNLEQKVKILDENPEVGFVHSNIMLIDPEGEVISDGMWNEHSRQDYIENGLEAFYRFLASFHLSSSIFIGAVLARRECYERLGGFNPLLPHCNDGEMWMRMLLFHDVACIGIPLVKYRVHPSSASSSWGDYTSISYLKEHYTAAGLILGKYKDRIPETDIWEKRVSSAFAARALKCACIDFNEGRFDSGRIFLKEAFRMSPGAWKSRLFLRAVSRLAVGKPGAKLHGKARSILRKTISG